jgi:hypothetical protein
MAKKGRRRDRQYGMTASQSAQRAPLVRAGATSRQHTQALIINERLHRRFHELTDRLLGPYANDEDHPDYDQQKADWAELVKVREGMIRLTKAVGSNWKAIGGHDIDEGLRKVAEALGLDALPEADMDEVIVSMAEYLDGRHRGREI